MDVRCSLLVTALFFLHRPNTLVCEMEPSDIHRCTHHVTLCMDEHSRLYDNNLAGVHTSALFYSTLLSNIPYCNTQVQ